MTGVRDENNFDADRIERIRAGDRATFDEIVSQYFAVLARCAYLVLQSREAAEDVAQEVLAEVWHRRATWRPKVAVRAYLLTAARHRALSRIRHEQVVTRYASQYGAGDDVAPVYADDSVLQDDAVQTLNRALTQLPSRTQQAVLLRYEVECSFPEIALALGISVPAAQKLVQRALVRLRELLEPAR